jgi:proline dehydrogenase
MKILYPLAKRFIAGHDFDSAKPKIKKLMDEGYEVSIDYLGELSTDVDDCHRATRQYLEIINYYWDKKINISIKPSQLGVLINPFISYHNLDLIAKAASRYGHTIRLDMEDSSVTDATRNQAISLNKKYGNVGVAIQANLHRTEEDLKILIDNNVSVRLVKGAYKESEDIAYQDEFSVGSSFFHYAATLYSSKSKNPAIATHDKELLEDIEELIPNPSYFDYELLYGIRRDLQKSLLNKQYCVRIYIPFGEQWLPYTLRRLKEWKNLKFVIKNIFYEIFR